MPDLLSGKGSIVTAPPLMGCPPRRAAPDVGRIVPENDGDLRGFARNHRAPNRTVGPRAMNFPNEFAARIMAAISALPVEERAEAIHALLSDMLKHMPRESILEMRQEVLDQFDPEIPIIGSTIDLIDGQLALRDISGQ